MFKNALCLKQIPEADYGHRVGMGARHSRCQRKSGHDGPHRSWSREWENGDEASVYQPARGIMHASRVIQRGSTTITSTLCGRSRMTSDGSNIADSADGVTCKFCLKMVSAKEPKS